MSELTRELNDAVQASLGIRVIDVRVKKIDLPDEVRQSVYDRMSAEREKLARVRMACIAWPNSWKSVSTES